MDPHNRLVQLDRDHPGFRDPAYRTRRDRIARLALDHAGGPAPRVDYSPREHAVWELVCERLDLLHQRGVAAPLRHAAERLALDRRRIPQLADVSAVLETAGRFQLRPVAGLVEPAVFLAALADSAFLATQYVRHPTAPLYTPEPDVIHELIGHAASLLQPEIAALSRAFGRCSLCGDATLRVEVERVYWWSLEFGAVLEDGELKAAGAGLLSSCGELERLLGPDCPERLPFEPESMATADYDPTDLQPRVHVAESWEAFVGVLGEWLIGRLARAAC